MTVKIDLVIIDPQNDFCEPGDPDAKPPIPTGALFVPGAENDMKNVAELIDRYGAKLDDIHVTMDCHHQYDIAHPIFWMNSAREHPQPFTIITVDDIRNGVWLPTNPAERDYAMSYAQQLQDGGRYPLCVWPPHCLIGSWGNNIFPPVYEALMEWEKTNIAVVEKVTKGSNYRTEHYSAVKSEVPDPQDPTTQINRRFISTLEEKDIILLAGEALSHCLANTVRDIADGFNDPKSVEKFVLLEDCTSSVPGFEQLGQDFISDMTGRGMKLAKAADYK
jgi:nicotinamidase-related amidase